MFGKTVIYLAYVFLLVSCITPGPQEPPIDLASAKRIKKVGLISVTSSRGIHGKDVKSGGIADVSTAMEVGNEIQLKKNSQKVLAHAYDSFMKSLSAVDGWQAVDINKINSKLVEKYRASRKEFADQHQTSLGFQNFIPYEKLIPYQKLESDDKKASETKLLQEIAKKFNLDAIAVVNINLRYEPSSGLSIGGYNVAGKALANTDTRLSIYDKKGMQISRQSKECKSENTTNMVSGTVAFNTRMVNLINETTDSCSVYFSKLYNDAMRGS